MGSRDFSLRPPLPKSIIPTRALSISFCTPSFAAMVNVADLHTLQEFDLAVDTRKLRLADIEAHLTETEELLSARAAFQEVEEKLRELSASQKELEWDTGEIRTKAAAIEKKLYGGTVRQPKELEDLQKDLEALRRQAGAEENKLLEIMLEVDATQKLRDKGKANLGATEEEWTREQAELLKEKAAINTELAELQPRRAAQASEIEGPALSLYEILRTRRQGKAIARVERGMCQGCRITLPMSLVQKARSGLEVVQCVSCERILFMN